MCSQSCKLTSAVRIRTTKCHVLSPKILKCHVFVGLSSLSQSKKLLSQPLTLGALLCTQGHVDHTGSGQLSGTCLNANSQSCRWPGAQQQLMMMDGARASPLSVQIAECCIATSCSTSPKAGMTLQNLMRAQALVRRKLSEAKTSGKA
jgi:hypothetical protein